MTQDNLGSALRDQAARTEGSAGAALLAEAVAAYRAALEVRTRAAHPVDWAMTQNNLGMRSSTRHARTEGGRRSALLAEAVAAYRAALEVRTRRSTRWTGRRRRTISAARSASQAGGPRGGGGALLAEAVAAYRAALEFEPARPSAGLGDDAEQPRRRARRPGGADRGAAAAGLLAEAVAAYRAALEVYTRGPHPEDWAMTQNNLGARARRPGGADRGARRGRGAAGGGGGSLSSRRWRSIPRAAHPVRVGDRRRTTSANALADQGGADRGAGGGRGCWRRRRRPTARRWRSSTRAAHPVDWAMTQENLGLVLRGDGGSGAGTATIRPGGTARRSPASTRRWRCSVRVGWSRTGRNARATGRGWRGSSRWAERRRRNHEHNLGASASGAGRAYVTG